MIHFIGAGPGAADLITVRGAKLLGEADCIIYAGSLVNPALLDYAKEGCEIHDSASMTLEEVIAKMRQMEREGKTTVRLHTGDPSLFGAIREQMDLLNADGISYDVTPGVSSFSGAAAALEAEYTLPNVSQSVIITRMEGRTPVPEGEKMAKMAQHGCTMVLFLSSSLLEQAQEELLKGAYTPETPAAIVYKATWPDEKVYRCTVGTLAQTARDNNVTKTALITIGGFLGDAYDRSRLYDPSFTHMFRTASTPDGEGRGSMKVAFIAFTRRGYETMQNLAVNMALNSPRIGDEFTLTTTKRLADEVGLDSFDDLGVWTGERFADSDALVFIGATGIAVRAIAPHVRDKFSDPAVVSVDEAGQFAVPLLSGHVGGANDLAREVAAAIGARAVVSTATDVNGLFAVDEWARKQGLALVERQVAKEVSACLLDGGTVGFASDIAVEGALPSGVEEGPHELGIKVGLDTADCPFARTLHLVPAARGAPTRRRSRRSSAAHLPTRT